MLSSLFERTGVLLALSVLIFYTLIDLPHYTAHQYGQLQEVERDIVFTGDIMLGREVERVAERNSQEYLFEGFKDVIADAGVAVGNFEGTVPEVHVPTPNFGMQFSVERSFVQILHNVGFDYLSLANNHSFDHGIEGYTNTRAVCEGEGLLCVGSAIEPMWSVVDVNGVSVGILAINHTQTVVDEDMLQATLTTMESETDLQIAYVHWGKEYEETHNASQEKVAHALIDSGIDAVMGHHPHVVQDIGVYKGAPIFYSLGNLVFDQYFSEEVQQGLLVKLTIADRTLTYRLIPVSSVGTPSQSWVMEPKERDIFLGALFARSEGVYDSPLHFSRRGLADRSIISTMRPH